MLYVWKSPEGPNECIAEYDQEISMDRFLFRKGIFLNKEQVDKPIIFNIEVTQAQILKYDALPNNAATLLVNPKITDILLAIAPQDVQFFDAEIRCLDGVVTHYKLVNITHTVIGIDHEHSTYTRLEPYGIINIIKYLTYKAGCMQNHKLARDEEYRGNILVTEAIKQAFEQANIQGPWLVTPEAFYIVHTGRESEPAAQDVAAVMDEIVAKGQAENWKQEQYSAALRLMLAQQRQNLRKGNMF